MKDRAENQNNNKIKILEAKHIQALSSHDQEMFLQLFYNKVRDLVMRYIDYSDDDDNGFDYHFASHKKAPDDKTPIKYDYIQPHLPPITQIEQLKKLMRSIRSIRTPSVEYNRDQLLAHYIELENSLHVSLPLKDKWLKELDGRDLVFLNIVIFIQERYLNLNEKYEMEYDKDQLDTLQNLYTPVGYSFRNDRLDKLQKIYTDPVKYITEFEHEQSFHEIFLPCRRFASKDAENNDIKMNTLNYFRNKLLDAIKKYPRADHMQVLEEIRGRLLYAHHKNFSENRAHLIVPYLQSVLKHQATIEKNAKEELSAKALIEQSFLFHPKPLPILLASPPKPVP